MEPAQGFAGIPNEKPIFTDITEFIGIAMKVSLLSGVVLAMPFVLYQMVMFVAPGLTPSERRYLYTLLPVSLLVFAAGAAFGYRILFPPAVRFLLTFGSDIATPFIRIGNYVNLMLSLFFWMGLLFETPVVLFFLARDRRGHPGVAGKTETLRSGGRLHPGGADHSDLRSCQSGDGGDSDRRAVRGRHLAGEDRAEGPQVGAGPSRAGPRGGAARNIGPMVSQRP